MIIKQVDTKIGSVRYSLMKKRGFNILTGENASILQSE